MCITAVIYVFVDTHIYVYTHIYINTHMNNIYT